MEVVVEIKGLVVGFREYIPVHQVRECFPDPGSFLEFHVVSDFCPGLIFHTNTPVDELPRRS